ncbi:MAG: type 2 isopentenyl-diphosphate Delta-isomerase, partial [Thermoprotei archaeon]
PTAASILEVRSVSEDIFLIGSGGIRNGIDVAKALRLGADFAGTALPVIRAVYEKGSEGVERLLRKMISELKIVIHLVGARNIAELKKAPIVITGYLREWMEQRGLSLR